MADYSTKEYIIDLNGLRDRADLHERIFHALPLPEWYGYNLDALFDVLTEPTEPMRIVFLNYKDAEKVLGAYANAFRHMIQDVMEENEEVECVFA